MKESPNDAPRVGDMVRTKPGALRIGIIEGMVTQVDRDGTVKICHTATKYGVSWLMSHEVEVIPVAK